MSPAPRPDRESLFIAYYLLGADRSLDGLRDLVAQAVPKPPALNTLKRWSAEDGWQRKIAELDGRIAAGTEERTAADIIDMNVRQARLGRMMQQAATLKIEPLTQPDADLSALTYAEASRLAKEGVTIERLATGEATERREIVVTTYNRVVMPIVVLFQQVVATLDPEQRARATREFARGVDAIRDEHFGDVLTGGR